MSVDPVVVDDARGRGAVEAAALGFRPVAVVFDMDGTMIESERELLVCWRQATQELGLAIDDGVWLSMVGLHDRACVELLHRHLPADDVARLIATTHALYDAKVAAGLPLKPDIEPLLQWLREKGVPRAVATSTQRPRALRKLEHAGLLDYFDVVVAGADVDHPKPAPDIYLLAANRLGVDPRACVAVEDSEPGVRAALAAGMTAIQIPDLVQPTAPVRALGHRIVASLAQVHALLEGALRDGGLRRD